MNLKLTISFLLPAAFMSLLVACGGGTQIADTPSPEAKVLAKAIVEPTPTKELPKPVSTNTPAPKPSPTEARPTVTAKATEVAPTPNETEVPSKGV